MPSNVLLIIMWQKHINPKQLSNADLMNVTHASKSREHRDKLIMIMETGKMMERAAKFKKNEGGTRGIYWEYGRICANRHVKVM